MTKSLPNQSDQATIYNDDGTVHEMAPLDYSGNPYDVITSQWVGIAAKTWGTNVPGFPKRNVYEYSSATKLVERVWDDSKKRWRAMNKKEADKFRDGITSVWDYTIDKLMKS